MGVAAKQLSLTIRSRKRSDVGSLPSSTPFLAVGKCNAGIVLEGNDGGGDAGIHVMGAFGIRSQYVGHSAAPFSFNFENKLRMEPPAV